MEQSSMRNRQAFTEASSFVMEVVDTVGDDEWGAGALESWTVAELVVHTTRAASTIVDYAGVPAERILDAPADYYVAVLDKEGIHETVAERARAQASEIDVPLRQYVTTAFWEAEQVLARTPANQVLGTRAGGITLVDYLPTRVVELVVHGIDLADALGRDPVVPRVAMEVTLETLGDLAVRRPDVVDPAQIVRALTGRGELPPAANLLDGGAEPLSMPHRRPTGCTIDRCRHDAVAYQRPTERSAAHSPVGLLAT